MTILLLPRLNGIGLSKDFRFLDSFTWQVPFKRYYFTLPEKEKEMHVVRVETEFVNVAGKKLYLSDDGKTMDTEEGFSSFKIGGMDLVESDEYIRKVVLEDGRILGWREYNDQPEAVGFEPDLYHTISEGGRLGWFLYKEDLPVRFYPW